MQRVFVTAHDIAPVWHVRMQAAFQRFTDNAVSKTVNFPNSAPRRTSQKVYVLAYRAGCKGVTIYRDGSRDVQVLNVGKGTEHEAADAPPVHRRVASSTPRPRPAVIDGRAPRRSRPAAATSTSRSTRTSTASARSSRRWARPAAAPPRKPRRSAG